MSDVHEMIIDHICKMICRISPGLYKDRFRAARLRQLECLPRWGFAALRAVDNVHIFWEYRWEAQPDRMGLLLMSSSA